MSNTKEIVDRQFKVLLLADHRDDQAGTLLEHIESFIKYSDHEVVVFNPCGVKSRYLVDFEQFDVIIIHYSLCVIYEHFISNRFAEQIKRFKGLKIQFIQDDYRWVNKISKRINELGIHVLYTLVRSPEREKVWAKLLKNDILLRTTLTGFVQEALLNKSVKNIKDRSLQVGYRGRELPYWLGALSQEKMIIGRRFKSIESDYDLNCDISWKEEDRIYGDAWIEFIASSKVQLGAESGSSITDVDGEIEKSVTEYLDQHPTASFEEVSKNVLSPLEGNIMMNVISPRVFEAVALKTALVMFPGHYSGILEPDKHYIVLNKDFSNIVEVIGLIRDDEYLQTMVDQAHADVIESEKYSYKEFIRSFDSNLVEDWNERSEMLSAGDCGPGRFVIARSLRVLALGSLYVKRKMQCIRQSLAQSRHAKYVRPIWRFVEKVLRKSIELPVLAVYFIKMYFKEAVVQESFNVFMGYYLFKDLRKGFHLLSLAVRLSSTKYSRASCRKGRQGVDKRVVDLGDGKIEIKLFPYNEEAEESSAYLSFDKLKDLFRKGEVSKISWNKSDDIFRGPILLSEREGVFPLLIDLGGSHPELVARMIIGTPLTSQI